MNGMINGIYEIVEMIQKVGAVLVILMLAVLGIGILFGGQEAKMKFKEGVKWIIIGTAILFCATELGKIIVSWFA